MARLLRFAAVAVLVGGATAGLSGCTGDADPVASPSPSVTAESPSPTPSASPSPTALSDEELLELIPEDARAENFGAASNFAKFFVQLHPQMLQTQDSSLFEFLSDEECVFCANALESLAALESENGTMTGGDITVDEGLASGGLQPNGTTNASFGAATTDAIYLDADGNVTGTTPGRSGRLGVSLRYENDHWVVLGVGSQAA